MKKQNMPYSDNKLFKIMKLDCVEELKFSPMYSEVKKVVFDFNLTANVNCAVQKLTEIAKQYEKDDSRYSNAIQALISYLKVAV